MTDGPQRCLVYCRLRPSKGAELTEEPLITLNGGVVKTKDDKLYNFDGTLGNESTQGECFDAVARPCLDNVLAGFKSAIMAYGQTGTGKSHTVSCNKPGQEGIIPRSAQYIFECVEAGEKEGKQYQVHLQFLQIYRDNLGDLMSDTGRERVDITYDKDKGVTLPGCSVHEVKSTEEFMNVYKKGDKRRVVAATAMNPESSRGHTALVVWVSCMDGETERRGKITFIDLAGYERFSKTGISNDNQVMKEEAKTINASLLALGHVVSSLSNGDKHIPWRDSKLTRLLQDSIGGRSRTTIVLTIGPSPSHLFETTNTLQFGTRAMAVKVQAKVVETVDFERLAAKLQSLLTERDERINALELQKTSTGMQDEELLGRHNRDMEQLRAAQAEELSRLAGMTDEKIAHVRGQHEVEMENLLEQQKEEFRYKQEQHAEETRQIIENLQEQHERAVAAMELRIQELEEELVDFRDMEKQAAEKAQGGEATKKPKRKSTLNDLPDIEDQVVAGRIDVGFYYDAVDAYEEAIDINQEKAVDMQVQLDKALKLAQERAEDLLTVQEHVKKLQELHKAQEVHTATDDVEDKLAASIDNILENKKSMVVEPLARDEGKLMSNIKMIDEKVHEQIVSNLQKDIKGKDATIEALRKLIHSGDPKAMMQKLGLDLDSSMSNFKGLPMITPRFSGNTVMLTARGLPPGMTPRVPGMTPRTSRGGPQCYGSSSAQTMVVEQLKLQLQLAQDRLDGAESRNVRLSDELSLLKMKIDEKAILAEFESSDEEEEAPAPAAAPSNSPVPKLALKMPSPEKVKKDKIAENPLIKELSELREKLEKEKKDNGLLTKEFASLLTMVDFHEFRTDRDTRSQAPVKQKRLTESDIMVSVKRDPIFYVNLGYSILTGTNNKKKQDFLYIHGMGNAISIAVQTAESIKRRLKGLYQVTDIDHDVIEDLYEGQECNRIFQFERRVPNIKITLSLKTLDKKHEGFQEPIPDSEVTESEIPVSAVDEPVELPESEVHGGFVVDYRKLVKQGFDGKDRRNDRRVDPFGSAGAMKKK